VDRSYLDVFEVGVFAKVTLTHSKTEIDFIILWLFYDEWVMWIYMG